MSTTPRPKEPHLFKEWVKYELKLRGYTLTALAKTQGASRETASSVFRKRYPKYEKIIANILMVMPCELWPERYPGESVIVPAGKRKSTRKTRGAQ
jgi:Ner family transcriptional regulator